MSFALDADHVLLLPECASKEEVIRAIGDVMLERGEVTPRYVEGMFEKEARFSTWVTEGVALPHGTNEVKREVRRNSVVLAQIPGGVDWGKGKVVYLAIGFAGQGDDEHVRLLTAIAGVLQDAALVSRLKTARDKNEVVRILSGR
jgi:mannitol PTS system EIIA component